MESIQGFESKITMTQQKLPNDLVDDIIHWLHKHSTGRKIIFTVLHILVFGFLVFLSYGAFSEKSYILMLIVLTYIVSISSVYYTKYTEKIKLFLEKRPILLLIAIIIAIGIFHTAITHDYPNNDRPEDRPTDCEYDAYHGWTCN